MRQVLGMEKLETVAGVLRVRAGGWVWLVLLLATGLLVGSCGDDDDSSDDPGGGGGPSGPEYTAVELNAMGWDSFAIGDYYDAWDAFTQAVAKDAVLYEARLGLAWSFAYTGMHADAMLTFGELISGNHLVNDARAGLAAAALFTAPEVAEEAAETVLAADADYVFSRRASFDHRDLQLILAEAYFAQQRYNLAQLMADNVADDLELPISGLDPVVATTWVVDGVTYATYHAALATVLQNLSLLLATHVPG